MNGSSPTDDSPTPASAEAARGAAPAVAVAVSGGADSMALLWVTWQRAAALGLKTLAFHVHHGLQPSADAWPDAIEEECRRWSRAFPSRPAIQLEVARLEGRPVRGQSVEEWAREGRYAALVELAGRHRVGLVLLAHHRRDQAETVLLQALRGAGPQGLAGMPRLQWRNGVCLARPWLAQPRESVAGLVQSAGLNVVHDPSNDDPRWARNRLRLEVWPVLSAAFEQAEAALATAAQRCAQSLELIDEAAQGDAQRCVQRTGDKGRSLVVDVSAWQGLSPARRSHVLRAWLRELGMRAPSALVDRVSQHAFTAQGARRWPLDTAHEVRWYRGELSVAARREAAGATPQENNPAPQVLRLNRAGRKQLPAWSGTLVLRRAAAGEPGLDMALPLQLMVRDRQGGDRFQKAPKSTARALKKQFQAGGVAAWDRTGPVVTTLDGAVVMVSGLGMDARVAVAGGRWVLQWEPLHAAGVSLATALAP